MVKNQGEKVDVDATVDDLIEAGLSGKSSLMLQYPVCFTCFDLILKKLDIAIKDQNEELAVYMEQLRMLEVEIQNRKQEENDPETKEELEKLNKEELELDAELAKIEEEEKRLEKQLKDFEKQKDSIRDEENAFWSEFNRYERDLVQQQEHRMQMTNQTQEISKLLKRL